jgi:phosphate-selective porin OprO/OprP
MPSCLTRTRWRTFSALLGVFLLCGSVRAQSTLPLSPESTARPIAPPVQPANLEQLEERLRATEATNRLLTGQLEEITKQHADQMKKFSELLTELSNRSVTTPTGQANAAVGSAIPVSSGTGASPVPDYTEGHFNPFEPAAGYPESNITNPYRFPLKASFGPGFLLESEDSRFQLNIHYESQIEGRAWSNDDQLPANSGLFLPRQRIFFDGHITKEVEYEFAINRGVNNINILNAYLNFHFDDRFQVRVGRFFTPLPYDQYAISNYWLLTPERSVFTTNLGLNRQIGAMAWGYLFDEQLDYAAGFFNGSRNSFESLNNNLDFVGYLNVRPFQQSQQFEFAKFLNVGASVAVGRQDQSPVPVTFRIAGGSPDSNTPGIATVPFLTLNDGVVERGERLVGSTHVAYFYKGLSLISEWQFGYGGYSASARSSSPSVKVPYSGFYVAGGYFLTGEEIERRTRVKPLRPLIPVNEGDRRGIGAWELAGRIGELRLGKEVFDAGLADSTIWSNRATTTELGLNWYWNEYVKVYMFWLHGEFGNPVQYRTEGSQKFTQKNVDMFWTRLQLYF